MSGLRLKRYFFPLTRVEANPRYRPGEPTGEFGVKIQLTPHCQPRDGIYAATLSVTSEASEDAGVPYAFEIVAFADFSFDEDSLQDGAVPGDELLEELTTESFRVLVGAAREHLAAVTARAPWGTFILPMQHLAISAE